MPEPKIRALILALTLKVHHQHFSELVSGFYVDYCMRQKGQKE